MVIGIGLLDLCFRVHDEWTTGDDRLMQWTARIEKRAQRLVACRHFHIGEFRVLSPREPRDIARLDRRALGADSATPFYNYDKCIVVGRQVLAHPGTGIEPELDHRYRHI